MLTYFWELENKLFTHFLTQKNCSKCNANFLRLKQYPTAHWLKDRSKHYNMQDV